MRVIRYKIEVPTKEKIRIPSNFKLETGCVKWLIGNLDKLGAPKHLQNEKGR